jgi:hypothetical protein
MKISRKIIDQLGQLVSGDTKVAPYLSGPQLVKFFNEFGFDDVYEDGFPTRWRFAAERIAQLNNTDRLRQMFEEFVHPRRLNGDEELAEKITSNINSLIKFDGLALIKVGNVYKVTDINGNLIQPETTKAIGHEFITDHVQKCEQKIIASDYSGAITNARTLVEAILIHIIEEKEEVEIKNEGNLLNLWSRTKKALKIDLKKEDLPESVFQILSGLDSALNGLASLSNNAGDRHANKFNTKRHHAKLAVNVAMTICDFLIDVLNNSQQAKP